MNYKLLISILAFAFQLQAQKLPESDALNRVILNHKDSIVYALIMDSDAQVGVHPSLKYMYYWYAAHDIKNSRGDFSGKLLHGQYVAYYEGKDLKSKGAFKKGLKTGKWKHWHKNGELASRFRYKKSRKQGKFYEYSAEGRLVTKGRYKKDKLNGRVRRYSNGEVIKESYKKGEQIEPKVKEPKLKRKSKKVSKDSLSTESKSTKKLRKKDKKKESEVAPAAPEEQKDKKSRKKKKDGDIRIRRFRLFSSQPMQNT